MQGRPVLHCWVSYPMDAEGEGRLFTAPALVSLDLAAELKERGYLVVGPDPEDEQALASYERAHPWFLRASFGL